MTKPVPRRQQIIDAARLLLGTPWKLQGRNEQGVDCGGLLVLIARAVGLPWRADEDTPTYTMTPRGDSLLTYLSNCGANYLGMKDPPPGSITVFWWNRQTKTPAHLGIMTDRQTVIHVYAPTFRTGHVTEDFFAGVMEKRLVAVYEFPGVLPWQPSS